MAVPASEPRTGTAGTAGTGARNCRNWRAGTGGTAPPEPATRLTQPVTYTVAGLSTIAAWCWHCDEFANTAHILRAALCVPLP